MKRIISFACMAALLSSGPISLAQNPAPTEPATQPAAEQQAPTPSVQKAKPAPTTPTLEDGTPVKLRIGQTVSSADAHVGQTVDFEVLEEVKVKGTLIIPKGGLAWATVTEAQSKRRMGRGGKLNMNIDSVRLVDGEKVALRAVKDAKGGGHVGAMTGAMVATGIVFFPAAPLFLFMHGKDITIPKGTEITAFISGDVPLDLAKFQPPAAPHPATTPAAEAQSASVEFTSNPVGAEIELDGSFIGNTPSTLNVASGDHTIKMTKSGFKAWQRTIKASAGNVKIAAELEKETTEAAQPKPNQ